MDRQAELQFREFFEARRHALSRSAFFLTGDHQLAEELLQEALTRTLVRWQHVAAGGNPEAYVRRVMLNEVRSRWRRRRRFVEELRPDPPETAHVSAMDDGTIDRTDLGAALRVNTVGGHPVQVVDQPTGMNLLPVQHGGDGLLVADPLDTTLPPAQRTRVTQSTVRSLHVAADDGGYRPGHLTAPLNGRDSSECMQPTETLAGPAGVPVELEPPPSQAIGTMAESVGASLAFTTQGGPWFRPPCCAGEPAAGWSGCGWGGWASPCPLRK